VLQPEPALRAQEQLLAPEPGHQVGAPLVQDPELAPRQVQVQALQVQQPGRVLEPQGRAQVQQVQLLALAQEPGHQEVALPAQVRVPEQQRVQVPEVGAELPQRPEREEEVLQPLAEAVEAEESPL